VDQCAVEAGRFALSELYLDGIVENELDPTNSANLDASAQNTCTGSLLNDNSGPFMEFNLATPISDCGTDVSSNSTHHSFKNAIQGYQGVEGSVITRKRKFFLTFECVYPISTEISADYAVNAILTEMRFVMDEQVGEYTASFELFEDNLYTTPLVSGADVWVPDYFYGMVVAEVPDADRFVTKVGMCWATPTSDPADANNVAFINNGCPVTIDADEGADDVQITESGTSDTVKFGIRAFSWTDENLGDNVFVHCIVSLCDFTQGDCTTSSCSSRKKRDTRQKRETIDVLVLDPITVGGFSVKQAESCETGGDSACGKHSTCSNSVRFDLMKYMSTKQGWVKDYTCECDYGYAKSDKHHCKAKFVPEMQVSSTF